MNDFEKELQIYDDDFILNAYKETIYLHAYGSFPSGQKYFRELWDLRNRTYGIKCSLDTVEQEILREIARRWKNIKEN